MLKRDGAHIVNIDHHHDNTRFGTVNHVVPEASCTAEIVWDLMRGLGVEPDAEIAEALYVGLVTDTGRFMYENTGPRAHVMAAELIEAGVDVHDDLPAPVRGHAVRASWSCWRARWRRCERYDDGRADDRAARRARTSSGTGAEENYSEGIIDHLRAVEGTEGRGAGRASSPATSRSGRKKVSLRATDGEVDVSAIARAQGGGGHRQAAGFTTELGDDELVAFLREQIAAQLAATVARPTAGDRLAMDGVLLVDKPAGPTSYDIVAPVRRALRRKRRSATPARWIRSRPGCCSSWSAAPRGSSAS